MNPYGKISLVGLLLVLVFCVGMIFGRGTVTPPNGGVSPAPTTDPVTTEAAPTKPAETAPAATEAPTETTQPTPPEENTDDTFRGAVSAPIDSKDAFTVVIFPKLIMEGKAIEISVRRGDTDLGTVRFANADKSTLAQQDYILTLNRDDLNGKTGEITLYASVVYDDHLIYTCENGITAQAKLGGRLNLSLIAMGADHYLAVEGSVLP